MDKMGNIFSECRKYEFMGCKQANIEIGALANIQTFDN
jgi:hypothetical protein